jgi:hypothetical protein
MQRKGKALKNENQKEIENDGRGVVGGGQMATRAPTVAFRK